MWMPRQILFYPILNNLILQESLILRLFLHHLERQRIPRENPFLDVLLKVAEKWLAMLSQGTRLNGRLIERLNRDVQFQLKTIRIL